MENRILLSGEVQSSVARETQTEVKLLVRPSADMVLHFLGPQLIDVVIPDHVMLPGEVKAGTFLRVHGLLVSDRYEASLSEFMAEVAPGLEGRIDWQFDPHEVKHAFSYSHVRATRIARRPADEALNMASLEGRIISRQRPMPSGRTHVRLYNYPDEPLGLYENGSQRVVYGTVSLDRTIQLTMKQHICVREGMVYAFTESESLGYFVTSEGLNVVWPHGFEPRQARKLVTNLAVAANKLYEVDLPVRVGEQGSTESEEGFLDYVDPSTLAQYDDSSEGYRATGGNSRDGRGR